MKKNMAEGGAFISHFIFDVKVGRLYINSVGMQTAEATIQIRD